MLKSAAGEILVAPAKRLYAQRAPQLKGLLWNILHPKGTGARLMLAFVYVPTLLLALYLFVFSSDMYVSETHISLRSSGAAEMSMPGGLLFSAASPIILDAFIVHAHITSMDMLHKILARVDLRAHYADRSKDVYSRLWANPTQEELLKYWQWLVTASFDPDKNIIAVEVKAYTPEMAKSVNDAVLAASEELVNQMNERAQQDTLRLTRQEVTLAEDRLLRARFALQEFRDSKKLLDPKVTAQGLEGLVARLEAEAATTQAELSAALTTLHKNSPRAQNLETRLNALREQLAEEKARLAGLDAQGGALSSLVGDYARLSTEEQFAQELLVKAMGAFETARLKAIAQSRYIVPFQPPTLPQESLYPRPFLFTAVGFVALLILLGMCSLIVAAIKDHMGA